MADENPFADLIPKNQEENPFSDLIPKGNKAVKDPRGISQALFPGLAQATEGFQLGLANAASGAKQLFDFNNADVQSVEAKEIARRDERIESLGGVGAVGAFAGEVTPSMIVPGGAGASLLRKVGTGVASDLISSVADPVREDQSRLKNLATTAVFGTGARFAGSKLSGLFNRVKNAKTGNIESKEIQKILETANKEDISVFFDDVAASPLAQKASVAAEIFGSFGTGAGRAKQNVEALNAANRWLKSVSGDFDDFEEIIQSGLSRKLQMFKKAAANKYQRVANKIGDAGNVETKLFDVAVDSGVAAELSKGTRANSSVQEFLSRFKNAPRGDFDKMIEFRSDFNKELSDFLKGDVSISKSSNDVLISAGKALDEDMARFAKSNGALSEWRAANDFYRNTVLQFKKGKLKALLNENSAANFDEQSAWKYLVQNTTNPNRAKGMWQALDSRARSAVRFGLIKEALEVSTRDGSPFSPARFATSLEKRLPVAEQFFKGSKGDELKGLVKVMRNIERAGQFAENPPTGNRLVPLLFAGVASVEPTTAAAAVTASLTLKTLFQTEKGRNFLLAANKAAPGSEKMDAILEGLQRFIARSSNQVERDNGGNGG